MNRSFAIFCLLVLLTGGVGYWQRGHLQGLIGGGGGGGGGSGSGDGGGGGGKKKPLAPVETENLKVTGIINSTRPSAMIEAFGTRRTIMVGDQVLLPLTAGKPPEMVRCERIEGINVLLYFPSNDTRMTLQFSK